VEPDRDAELQRQAITSGDVFVAEGQIGRVGYLRLEWFWSRIPYIAMIRVEEPLRGQGIGKAMLAFLEDRLRTQAHTLLLSSSTANEPLAQRWHHSAGFDECGFIAGLNDHGIGEIFFRKSLT